MAEGQAREERERRLELQVRELRETVLQLREEKKAMAHALAVVKARAGEVQGSLRRWQPRAEFLAQMAAEAAPAERTQRLMAALFATWRELAALRTAAERGRPAP